MTLVHWLALATLVSFFAIGTAVCIYRLGIIEGFKRAGLVVTKMRSDEEARRLVAEVAGMTPAGRNEMVHMLLSHDPPLIDEETARRVLGVSAADVVTGVQCRTCLRAVENCSCPMAQRKGRA